MVPIWVVLNVPRLWIRLYNIKTIPLKSNTLFSCAVFHSPVLKPAVALLSNPDYINQMLLAQLERREQVNEHHKRAYTYAPSYEEFIKLINSNADVEFLKQLRYLVSS